MKVLILITMVFCHIIDDFVLQSQGILALMKQEQWWKDNAPEDLYKYDYIVALFMHSFSWAFMTMIIPTIYLFVTESFIWWHLLFLFIWNICIHAVVDDLKANKKKINLILDQSIHMVQIICTWIIMIAMI